MKRLREWPVDLVSRLLESDERDAVRGDFAESGETTMQALSGLLGLVLRRQAILWSGWRPWLTLVVLIAPLGMLLSVMSQMTADQSATYIWLYANNWDWSLLKYTEFWYEFADAALFVLLNCVTLACWSWTAGFLLGSTSRRIVRVYGVVFCLVLVFGALWVAPEYLAYLAQSEHGRSGSAGGASAVAFYRTVFPLLVQAVLVAAPFLWGMGQGAVLGRVPSLLRFVLLSAAVVTITALVTQQPGFGYFLITYWPPWIGHGRQMRMLSLIAYWPLLYLTADAILRRRNRRIASV